MFIDKDAQKIKISIKIEKVEIRDPKEEIIFHSVYGSGKSEYRRGIPLRPKKCWGKKVIFTPKNMEKNWIFNHLGLRGVLNNKGNQWVSPPRIANTAPIDKT